jgi:alpha-D-ribose 1-methylphosphonate 5-triphosphate diphosphatase PhnM
MAYPGDWRLAATGSIAVIAAVAINGMVELALELVRRGGDLDDGIAKVANAATEDAATRADHGARVRLDSSGSTFLADEERWQDYENGEAHDIISLAPTKKSSHLVSLR